MHEVGEDDDIDDGADAPAPAGITTDWWQIRAQTQSGSQQSDEGDSADTKTQGENKCVLSLSFSCVRVCV